LREGRGRGKGLILYFTMERKGEGSGIRFSVPDERGEQGSGSWTEEKRGKRTILRKRGGLTETVVEKRRRRDFCRGEREVPSNRKEGRERGKKRKESSSGGKGKEPAPTSLSARRMPGHRPRGKKGKESIPKRREKKTTFLRKRKGSVRNFAEERSLLLTSRRGDGGEIQLSYLEESGGGQQARSQEGGGEKVSYLKKREKGPSLLFSGRSKKNGGSRGRKGGFLPRKRENFLLKL